VTLHDLEQPLADSLKLRALADHAGITEKQARAVFATLADMDIRDVIRIGETCRCDRVRQANREARR